MTTDPNLQQRVQTALVAAPSVNAAHVGVIAKAGVVTLTGHVESYAEKHAAEAATLRVQGVVAVADEIEVMLAFERTRGDDDIAAAVVNRLDWDVFIPVGAVKVTVQNG